MSISTPSSPATPRPLRHVELFAGAGGMALGFHRAGYETVALAEIDPWLQRVLRARFPGAEVLGDVNGVDGAALRARHGAPDLLAMGSPCQDLSVAGYRLGIRKGERSSLFFMGVQIFLDSGAPLLLWENVVGAMSSHSGKDFSRVLSTLVGAAAPVPRNRRRKRTPWPRAGVVRGPAGVAAWRVLDAQYVPGDLTPPDGSPARRAVAQRRRRVFVLFSRDGRFDPAAALHEVGALGSGRAGGRGGREVPAHPEGVRGDRGASGAPRQGAAGGPEGGAGVAGGARPDGLTPAGTVFAFQPNASVKAGGFWCSENLSPTLAGVGNGGNGPAVGIVRGTAHTRGGLIDGIPTYRKSNADVQDELAREGQSVVAFDWQKGVGDLDHPRQSEMNLVLGQAPTLGTTRVPAIVTPAPAPPAILPFDMAQLTHPENRSQVRDGDPYPSLSATGRPHVALAWPGRESPGELEVADPITVSEGSTWTHEGNTFRLHNVVMSFKPSHFTREKDGAPSEVSHPLSADVDKGDQYPIVLAAHTEPHTDALAPSLNARDYKGPGNYQNGALQATVIARGIVRRLTPTECCRLMCWPDSHLDVPLNDRGQMPSDTRKYKATGNGVASNVAEWLARRIDMMYPESMR